MIEPMTARDLLTGFYAAFVIMGGVYLLTSIPTLWTAYRLREKRKRKGKQDS